LGTRILRSEKHQIDIQKDKSPVLIEEKLGLLSFLNPLHNLTPILRFTRRFQKSKSEIP